MNLAIDVSDAALKIAHSWPSLAAFLSGWAFSVGLTMLVKKLAIPRWWHSIDRDLTVRIVAFFSAMVPAGSTYVALGGDDGLLWLVMIFTGLWSPIAYAGLILWMRTRTAPFWTRAADLLSGDPK